MRISVRRTFVAAALTCAAALATASPCSTGTLTSWVALGSGGCTVGSLTFSDFAVEAFPGPTALQIAPDSVSLAPVAGGFSLGTLVALPADSNELLGLRVLFNVASPGLTGGTVALGSSATANGDGAISGLLDAGIGGNAIALVIDGFSDATATFTSAPFAFYSAFFELGIDGGTFGSASLGPGLATLTFSAVAAPVPEPSTTALSLIGLIGVVVALRRNRRRV